MKGKDKCRILKEIRQRIADENDIPYVTRECGFHGECTGTCPRCESELRYLEQQLERRRRLGKRVSVAALCVGMALASTGCSPFAARPTESVETDLAGAVEPVEPNIEDLSGEIDVCEPDSGEPTSGPDSGDPDSEEPTSGPDSGELTGNDLSGADVDPEPEDIELSGEVAWPEDIELSGDVALPEGYDSTGSDDTVVTTTGEVAWPEGYDSTGSDDTAVTLSGEVAWPEDYDSTGPDDTAVTTMGEAANPEA